MGTRSGRPRIVWVVDWTDREHDDFLSAVDALGLDVRVIRSRPTGRTVGTKWHRRYSYPTYISLAFRAMLARADVLVAWQPIIGSLLAYVPFRPPIVAIEPVVVDHDRRLVGRYSLRALKRIECLVMCADGDAERLVDKGFPPDHLAVVIRGIAPRCDRNGPGQNYFLAGGREHRDWACLREAAAGAALPVRLGAPNSPSEGGSLQLLAPLNQADYIEQLRHARALVVPLKDNSRGAGLLTVLEAYSYGVPVIASRNIATVDYVVDGAGVLVDPGDPDALRRAMCDMSRPDTAAAASTAASAVLRSKFSLVDFVRSVHELARRLA